MTAIRTDLGSRRDQSRPGRHAWLAAGSSIAFILGVILVSNAVGTPARQGTAGLSIQTSASPNSTAGTPQLGKSPANTGIAQGAEIARAGKDLPAPITRTAPTTVHFDLTFTELKGTLDPDNGTTYDYWTFDNKVPGPMLRVMQGDTVEIHVANATNSIMAHSIDLHAVTGPGGGSGATQTVPGKDSTFTFKALNAGLYIYHCATPPVAVHIANGMFGMILVEPPGGLPRVDREFYVMQSEMYLKTPFGTKGPVVFSYEKMLSETASYYVFNGRVGSLTAAGALHANVGETVRIFFGVGTFKSSNFHVIGTIFDQVYSDGGIGGPAQRNVGVITVPAGGTSIVEIKFRVPGTYLIVDHALPRVSEGALGQIVVAGSPNPEVFNGTSGTMVH